MDGTTLVIVIGVIVVVIGAAVLLSRRSTGSVSNTDRSYPSPAEKPAGSRQDPPVPPSVQPSPVYPPSPVPPPESASGIPLPRPSKPITAPPIEPEPDGDDGKRWTDNIPAPAEEQTRGIGDYLDRVREEEDEETRRSPTQQQQQQSSREPVEFTAYYPKEIAPNVWADLLAYVYRVSAADDVKNDAQGVLGAAISAYRRVARPEQTLIMEEAQITITPRLTGFQFNPVSATVGFFDAFNRANFKVRANSAPPGEVHEGMITFTVEGIIVCEIPLYIEVNPNTSIPIAAAPTAPLVTAAPPRKAYQAVFCSYSRKDLQIVERVERAYRILGFDYLRDLTTIRPGEDWDSRLLQMIEQADIFQLFWSSNSANSAAVRKEWTKALELAGARQSFIRPVFWEQPMPAPPPELGHINFAFEPTLDD